MNRQTYRVNVIPIAIGSAGALGMLVAAYRPNSPSQSHVEIGILPVLAVVWAYYFLTDIQADSGGVTARVWGMRGRFAWSDIDRCESEGKTLYLVPTEAARRENPRIAHLCSYLNTERLIIGRGYRNAAHIAAELEGWRLRGGA